jgi:cation:H+ antiporter
VSARAIGRDGVFALIAAGLFIWFAQRMDALGWFEGVLMLAVLLAMILISYAQESAAGAEPDGSRHMRERPLTHSAVIDVALIIVGIATLVLGAEILVQASITIARANGISETVIGLTLIAAGTSLPELATSVVAALRGNPDIAVGTVVGSNIYNILAILGVASMLGPVEIDQQIKAIDMWVMLAATVALFPPLLFANRIGRTYGLLLFAGYLGYVAYLFQKAGILHFPVN